MPGKSRVITCSNPICRSVWSRSAIDPAISPTLPRAAGEEPAEQRAGRAPGGGIVDADIVRALRPRHVGDERHDGDAGIGQVVDRRAHRRVIEGDDGNPVDLALQLLEGRRQDVAVEDVDMGEADRDALLGEGLRGRERPAPPAPA